MGVVICNTPDLCIEEIADSAMSFILSFYRPDSILAHRGSSREAFGET